MLAVQLIGAYFLDKLETNLNTNFEANLDDRLTVLKTNLEEAFQEKKGQKMGKSRPFKRTLVILLIAIQGIFLPISK